MFGKLENKWSNIFGPMPIRLSQEIPTNPLRPTFSIIFYLTLNNKGMTTIVYFNFFRRTSTSMF